MKHLAEIALLMVAMGLVSGCSNQMYSWSYSPINEKYSRQLNQISLGMTKQELVDVLPDLVPRGQAYVGTEVVEALELQHNYWAGVGGQLVHDRLWFYLYNNVLVKWGRPNDWPAEPDLIIEHRRQ